MTNEQIEMLAISMDTPTLASWIQDQKTEYYKLKGTIQFDQKKKQRFHYLRRHIKIMMRNLKKRQKRMGGGLTHE